MSDAARAARWRPRFAGLGSKSLLSGAGRAGPRRLVVIGAGGIAILVLVTAVVMGGRHAEPFSSDARMGTVDALPGGLHSTPQQNALAQTADTAHARAALAHGTSYTPPLAPSAVFIPQARAAAPAAAPPAPPAPHFAPHPRPSPIVPVSQTVFPAQTMQTPAPDPAPQPQAAAPSDPVVVASNPKAVAAYSTEIHKLFGQWNGQAPQTVVVLPPGSQASGASGDPIQRAATAAPTSNSPLAVTRISSAAKGAAKGRVLIPAGRGVYAHPILALSSDQTSPVVLQADSGPIAGDRMIGSFERQHDRLVIHINSIVRHGQTISCDGLVIAPDTMQAAVATSVNQHILSRVILPAAAAFVQGLGQALATTSNTISVLSPFGGASTATNLNFPKQLGVAAGVAAGQVGNELDRAAPTGPTVTLAANVGVGVMFLSDVRLPPSH